MRLFVAWLLVLELVHHSYANIRENTVVDVTWVHTLINYNKMHGTTRPENYPYEANHPVQIFETNFGPMSKSSYLNGHIPGAIYSDSDIYENGYPRWHLLPKTELQQVAEQMGVTLDSTVVIYSSYIIHAARLWFILKYLGVADVRFVNGSYSSWIHAGYEGETKINYPSTSGIPLATITTDTMITTNTQEIKSLLLNDPLIQLVDVRSIQEFRGWTSGYYYLVAKGRLPTATWGGNADCSIVQAKLQCDYEISGTGFIRPVEDIIQLWTAAGINFSKNVIFYCGGGYRSSLAVMYAYLLGLPCRNFLGGWSEWSTDFDRDLSGATFYNNTIESDPMAPDSVLEVAPGSCQRKAHV